MPSSTALLTWIPLFAAACGVVKNDREAPPDAAQGFDAAARLASSCATLGSSAMDQNVRLYFDGDPNQPYSAHCSADLKTYIPLQQSNTSTYPLGGCSTLSASATAAVTTSWEMVRLDTVMHAIDTSDYAFATSTGGTHESSGDGSFVHDFLSLPFGSGRSCASSAQAVATIDLTGTHFAIATSQNWAADGYMATANVTFNATRTKATVNATGFPIGASPCAPNSDYYTLNGGTCIQLEYVP